MVLPLGISGGRIGSIFLENASDFLGKRSLLFEDLSNDKAYFFRDQEHRLFPSPETMPNNMKSLCSFIY
jgi:hypothetical protein